MPSFSRHPSTFTIFILSSSLERLSPLLYYFTFFFFFLANLWGASCKEGLGYEIFSQ